MSSGESTLKQRDTSAHLVEWPKSRILTPPNAGGGEEQQEFSFIDGGSGKWCGRFGRLSGGFLEN